MPKKRTISIFVAGSTTLNDEFQTITDWKNLRNEKFDKGLSKYRIKVGDYRNQGDTQQQFNERISQADMVFFVGNGDLGEISRRELCLAFQCYAKEKRPWVKIFLKNPSNTFNDWMKDNFGEDKYPIKYESKEHLRELVDDEYDRYLRRRWKTVKGNRTIRATFATLLLCIATVWVVHCFVPKLIVFGGGSAANYIEATTYQKGLMHNPWGIYVHTASFSGLSHLKEEFVEPQDPRKFLTVCISGDSMTKGMISNDSATIRAYLDYGVIVELPIGEDPLVVYRSNNCHDTSRYRIDKDSLWILISNNKSRINSYSTSLRSATLHRYAKVLDKSDTALFRIQKGVFSDESSWLEVDTPFVLLGSEYYTMKRAKNSCSRWYVDAPPKQLYIYFIADSKGENRYHIPLLTRLFLRSIGVLNRLEGKMDFWGNIQPKTKETIILRGDQLESF